MCHLHIGLLESLLMILEVMAGSEGSWIWLYLGQIEGDLPPEQRVMEIVDLLALPLFCIGLSCLELH